MVINLNLLDPVQRKTLVHERFLLMVKDIMITTLGTIAMIASLLTVSKAVLSNDLEEAAARTNIVSSKNQPVQQAIRELNTSLRGIAVIIDEYTPWSVWLTSFFSLVPPGNQINVLSLQRDPPMIALRGTSRTRSDLLAFKDNIESSPLFKEMRFPLSNLLFKENIDFEFSVAINPASLPLSAILPSP